MDRLRARAHRLSGGRGLSAQPCLGRPAAGPWLRGKVASFTSISGPSLAYASRWLRQGGHLGPSLRQLLTSTYMALFQLPVLPELAARAGVIRRGAEKVGGFDPHRGLAETSYGVNLYRANVVNQMLRTEPRRTLVPTLVLVPTDDKFSSPPLAAGAPLAYRFDLPNANHVFLPGHRVMVQVQSSWFPLYDRNPQTFVDDIMLAPPSAYRAATQRVYHAPGQASYIALPVVAAAR